MAPSTCPRTSEVFRLLLDLLYPPKCPFCGRILERDEDDLCALCQHDLPWTDEGGKAVEHCDACLSPLWYSGKVPDGIRRYKFSGGRVHAGVFGSLMAQCLLDRHAQPVDLITWTPLHPKRKRERGYDQAELLARRVGDLTGLPVVPALEKVRSTRVQSQLRADAARCANVHGAYRALPESDLSGKRVLLVDDVTTSGATLSECAAALRRAGAASVTALTLARAR